MLVQSLKNGTVSLTQLFLILITFTGKIFFEKFGGDEEIFNEKSIVLMKSMTILVLSIEDDVSLIYIILQNILFVTTALG